MDDEFKRTIWPRLTETAKARLKKIFDEYGLRHRDLTDAEIEESSEMVVRIVREDLKAQEAKENMKQQLGAFLMVFGLIVLGLFTASFTVYKFSHETLTETQLAIWSLQRWWCWLPATVVGFLGIWMMRSKDAK